MTPSLWPYITMQDLNLDWIFKVLIPEIRSLKESYDQIQSTITDTTQDNYNRWLQQLQADMAQLSSQITQSNNQWRESFAADNRTWQTQVTAQLSRDFGTWTATTLGQIETWEHDTAGQLTQLINDFAADITAAEANAKAYADSLNAEQRAYTATQIHQLNDALQHQINELQGQVTTLNANFAALKTQVQQWQADFTAANTKWQQDFAANNQSWQQALELTWQRELSEWTTKFTEDIEALQTSLEGAAKEINARISSLTAADIDAIDPITGEHDNVQFVLRHLHDAFSDYRGTITAREYQQLALTAQDYQDLHYKAIIYSLFSWYLLKIRSWHAPEISYSGEYVRPEELERRLLEYVKQASLNADLADYLTTNDFDAALVEYAKTQDVQSSIQSALMPYMTANDTQALLTGYTTQAQTEQLRQDIAGKASTQQVEQLRSDVWQELGNYAQIKDIPDVSGLLSSADAAATYETIAGAAATYAKKSDVPDVSGLLSKTDAATTYETIAGASTTYAPKATSTHIIELPIIIPATTANCTLGLNTGSAFQLSTIGTITNTAISARVLYDVVNNLIVSIYPINYSVSSPYKFTITAAGAFSWNAGMYFLGSSATIDVAISYPSQTSFTATIPLFALPQYGQKPTLKIPQVLLQTRSVPRPTGTLLSTVILVTVIPGDEVFKAGDTLTICSLGYLTNAAALKED